MSSNFAHIHGEDISLAELTAGKVRGAHFVNDAAWVLVVDASTFLHDAMKDWHWAKRVAESNLDRHTVDNIAWLAVIYMRRFMEGYRRFFPAAIFVLDGAPPPNKAAAAQRGRDREEALVEARKLEALFFSLPY